MERSGYCAVRTRVRYHRVLGLPILQPHDLDDFTDLVLRVRGDGRTYSVTVQTDGLVPEDVFQAFLYTAPSQAFETVRVRCCRAAPCAAAAKLADDDGDQMQVPLEDFLLTYHGFVQNDQPLMNKARVKTLGIVLADEREGAFCLDVAWVKATGPAAAAHARRATVPPP
jgi:NADH dehydrogenase [ubiquinone] 1 alpha subcomplex assembly factor 1